jgi:Ca-activated chloride channel homolog
MKQILICALFVFAYQETLNVKVELVTLGVRVTDAHSHNVSGLKAKDFVVFDDGIPVPIKFFSAEEQPLTLGILLDRSASMRYGNKIDRAKDAAITLARAVNQRGAFFFLAFDHTISAEMGITTYRSALEYAIQQVKPGGETSLYDAILRGIAVVNQSRLPRQAMLLISDGADTHSMHTLEDARKAVRESTAQIFTIGYYSREEARLFRTSGSRVQTEDGQVIDNPREVLTNLAEDSGAQSYFPESDQEMQSEGAEIAADLKAQYTIAFYPPPDDNKQQHQLQVLLRDKKDHVRVRRDYWTANPN